MTDPLVLLILGGLQTVNTGLLLIGIKGIRAINGRLNRVEQWQIDHKDTHKSDDVECGRRHEAIDRTFEKMRDDLR